MYKKIFLSIAASDSIGGAGIQADNRTAVMLGLYPVNVITAVTAQNTFGISAIQKISGKLLAAQFDAVLKDFTPDSVKVGLLPSPEAAEIIADKIRQHKLRNVIVDPVLAPTKGGRISKKGMAKSIIENFADIATLITPNLPELKILEKEISQPLDSVFSNVLVKGGHSGGKSSDDRLLMHNEELLLFGDRLDTPNTHGSGCVLSSAIACFTTRATHISEAVDEAKRFVYRHLKENMELEFGRNNYGPVIY